MKLLNRLSTLGIVFTLIAALSLPSARVYAAGETVLNLPAPGSMVQLSQKFVPAYVKGISIYPDDPFKFDFIIDTGNMKLNDQQFKEESQKLIKYFMAALTVPEKEDWVNLSPYEKDRIIPESLGITEMGRDMLAQDYLLKQLTSSLMYPEKEIGKEFWSKVYEQAQKQFGTTNIPMNTFNKVWIVPSQAVVWEHENSAYVVRSHLKVMLEQDYLALNKNLNNEIFAASGMDKKGVETNAVASNVVREVVLPALEKEVNEGANFATLRQIFNSAILAAWYKQNLKESILGQVYANQNKVSGIDLADKQTKQKIYERYLQAFKKGAFNFIKEDNDPSSSQPVARKYFSGGVMNLAMVTDTVRGAANTLAPAAQASLADGVGSTNIVTVKVAGSEAKASPAMLTAEELREANRLVDGYTEEASTQIALTLGRSPLRGSYQPVARILGDPDDAKAKTWVLTEAKLNALREYYDSLQAAYPDSDYIKAAVRLLAAESVGGTLTDKQRSDILRGALKKTADALAAQKRQEARDKFGVISRRVATEGISDGVREAGRAGQEALPSYLEDQRAEIENAINVAVQQKLEMQAFRMGDKIFPIIEEGNDDLEGTDAYVDDPANPDPWFSGSTSVSIYALGVGSITRGLGFIPDEAYAGQFFAYMGQDAQEFRNITVEEKNRHGEMERFHLYDPELYALNPDRFIEVLKFKARKKFGDDSAESLAKLKVAVTVMNRPTEKAFIAALERMKASGIGVRSVLIAAGTIAHGKKAVLSPEQFEAKYGIPYGDEDVIMLTRGGPVEAGLTMADAKENEENGAIGALRIFSGNMQKNPAGGNMENQGQRYAFSDGSVDVDDNEVEIINQVREETGDAQAVLEGLRVFTTADMPSYVKTSTTVIVGSPFLGQPGVTQNADGMFEVKNITAALIANHVSDPAALAQDPWRQGGINLDAALYNTQVLRDGKGVVLPVSQQPIGQFMKIKGFKPVFINIERNINLPARLGMNPVGFPKERLAQAS